MESTPIIESQKKPSLNRVKPDEMKGGDLMKNLRWLGQFGHLRTLLDSSDEGNVCDNDEDEDNLVQQRSGDLIGGGSKQLRKCNNDASYYKFEEERNIRCAMPEVEGTLRNWTLHRQNLGTMLKNYKRQYRHLPPNHRRELSQFFNTTATVLDTIGSMMENAILRSVEFDSGGNNHGGGLTGGGMDNTPQPKLPLTKYNLLRYVAFFPDYQLDNSNVLRTTNDDDIFYLLSPLP